MEIYDGLLALLGQGRLPWLTTLDAIKNALTGDIAKAIGSIAVVIGGMMVAFGEFFRSVLDSGLIPLFHLN